MKNNKAKYTDMLCKTFEYVNKKNMRCHCGMLIMFYSLLVY